MRDRVLRDAKVASSNALMPLYPSALILRIFVYLLTSINFAGPSNAHNDETANSRAFHRAKSRLKRSLFGEDIWGSVNFTKILDTRQLRASIGRLVEIYYFMKSERNPKGYDERANV